MIGVVAGPDARGAERLVLAALRRSVSAAQAAPCSISDLPTQAILVVISPDETLATSVIQWLDAGLPRKCLILGPLPSGLAQALGARSTPAPRDPKAARAGPAPVSGTSDSTLSVAYGALAAQLGSPRWRRSFERFDFAAEWNNLGYGAIRLDGSIWSASGRWIFPGPTILASIEGGDDAAAPPTFAALVERENAAELLFDRSVGPIDGPDWLLVETFLASFRSRDLPCCPVISEVPFGFDAAITMRLDCDEDLASAEGLMGRYRGLGVPLSLAVHTEVLLEAGNRDALRRFAGAGGTVLAHSATHAANWGGSYDAARREANHSARTLEALIGSRPAYAVAPFHHLPDFAVSALADEGYGGCVAGIIANDPQHLLARGGTLADGPPGFVLHSQQCMLHGDCLVEGPDPLRVYKAAFDQAHWSRTLFGYLDHPFSPRYSYGWASEAQRSSAHENLVAHIRTRASNPLFLDEVDALDWLAAKCRTSVVSRHGRFQVEPGRWPSRLPLAVLFKGQLIPAKALPEVA